MTTPEFEIAGRRIGPDEPVYVIAELSANHNHDLATAEDLVRAAARAGADAIKLQTYTPETITVDCSTEPFQIQSGSLWDGKRLYDLYAEAYTPWDWYPGLAGLAAMLGMDCFSSVFDDSSVDFLEKQDVPAYKVSSFELVDIPLIERVAATGKPVILSTGMAKMSEIDEAVLTLRNVGGSGPLALLHTNSGYPASTKEIHLRTIEALAARHHVVVGLSDHTLGVAVPVAAVAVGARIIEKHLTLSRADPTPDSAFSLEPDEFKEMVDAVRTVSDALGQVRTGPTEHERTRVPFRRSLFVVNDIKAGELYTPDNVRSIRPATGLHTRHLKTILGSRASRDVAKGTPMSWELISPEEQ